ncbi:recombinase family protein [Tsukamurella tyrosinosolvens]|nr:recombinase family protein [Tsukamurella tyrosinosolvens]
MTTMNLKEYAPWHGISYATARRWFDAGTLPHPARREGRRIVVEVPDEPSSPEQAPAPKPKTAAYVAGRSPEACSKRVDAVRAWADAHGMRIETSAADDDGSNQRLLELLADPSVTRIITDRVGFNRDLIAAALAAHGRELITTSVQKQQQQKQPEKNSQNQPRIAQSAGA